MGLKTKIKNDLWRFNYILPFIKKYQFENKGKVYLCKDILNAYLKIHPVKGKGKRTVAKDTAKLLKKVKIDISPDDEFIYFIDVSKTIAAKGNIISNFTLDYKKIIDGSFLRLVERAVGPDSYGQEAEKIAEGLQAFCNRVLEAIEKSELRQEIKVKRHRDFKNMLQCPAEHFEEALQRILFFNQILWQTRHRLNGFGRLDYILGALYQKDISTQYLDRVSAENLIYEFLRQANKYYKFKSDALEGDIGQIIILGGLNSDGSYFSNDLTELFLKAQAKINNPDPKTLLRVSEKMPSTLLNIAVDCLKAKTGSPLFSNDDIVIPALLTFGLSEEDAYSYCTSACWEPYITGKSFDQNNIAVFDYFETFDKLLNSEKVQMVSTFDDLLQEYNTLNKSRFADFLFRIDELKWAKDPLVSIFTDTCSEKRKDISEGGALYNNYGITTVGLSNTVDSLLNLKRLVFDEKRYSIQDLNNIRESDFVNEPKLYEELRLGRKYYGHDDKKTAFLVNTLTNGLADVSKSYVNKLEGTVKFGVSSPAYNMLCKKTTADLSGRKAKMPYNTHISCVDAVYTELTNFAGMLEYDNRRFNGNVVDFFITPDFLIKNKEKFVLFLQGAIKTGFFQMQMNVIDSATLIQARKNPSEHRGLIVRVWGFSAYFNELPESYKNLLIERAIKAEAM